MGTYMMNYSAFDFFFLIMFGLLGYSMQKLDIPIPPLVLALILGDTLEKTFRQAMVAKSGSLTVFLDLSLIHISTISRRTRRSSCSTIFWAVANSPTRTSRRSPC